MKTIIIIVVLLCLSQSLVAEGTDFYDNIFESSSKNPHIEGYFSETMNSLQKGMLIHDALWMAFLDITIDAHIENFLSNEGTNSEISQVIGFGGHMLPLLDNLALPIFGGLVISSSKGVDADFSLVDFLIGTGVVYYGRYGVISGCLGYGGNFGDGKLLWGIFPVLNAEELPFLSSFVSIIDGFFQMDRDIFQASYKANVLFKDISFNIWDIDTYLSFSIFTEKNWFNIDTKYTLYAGKLDLVIPDLLPDFSAFLFTTIGYREFVDTERNMGFYESGGYIRIATGGFWESESFAFQLTLESSVKPFFTGCFIGLYIGFNFDMVNVLMGSRLAKHGFGLGTSVRAYYND